MSEFKKEFFEKGYVSKIKIFDKSYTSNIYNEYLNFLNSKQSKANLVEHKSKTHLYFPWANEIIHNKKLLDYVEKIIGPNFFCWNSLIFHKHPKSKYFVSMHQDQNYWGIIHDKALSVQLAISNSTEENGCLKLIPHSHRENFEHKDYDSNYNILARGQSISQDDYEKKDLTNIELESGECCIFHGNIVHGSYKNDSDKHRLLFTMRFLTTDNKIQEKFYYNYASLVRGSDEYNYFQKEEVLTKNNLSSLRKLHKKIMISQFSKYGDIKLKFSFLTRFFMIFFKFDFLRSFFYILKKKS
jgi:non-haem Fe2+, alpha-ketoglutarate-dependent halogenase